MPKGKSEAVADEFFARPTLRSKGRVEGVPKYALVNLNGRTSTSAYVRLAIQRRRNGAFCERPGNLLSKACTSN